MQTLSLYVSNIIYFSQLCERSGSHRKVWYVVVFATNQSAPGSPLESLYCSKFPMKVATPSSHDDGLTPHLYNIRQCGPLSCTKGRMKPMMFYTGHTEAPELQHDELCLTYYVAFESFNGQTRSFTNMRFLHWLVVYVLLNRLYMLSPWGRPATRPNADVIMMSKQRSLASGFERHGKYDVESDRRQAD